MQRLIPAALLAIALASAGETRDGRRSTQATISNGMITAKLYLPDAEKGYYRGTRFDWSGVFASLTYKGHEYFGPWFDKYDPKIHDAISGPVEEFFSGSGREGYETATAPGYDAAKPGETFLRIGVGMLRKPEEAKFNRFKTYEIANGGHWTEDTQADRVTFQHILADEPSGYGYDYTKEARLDPGKPVLVLRHSLKNTGKKTISTEVYDHNFLTIDHTPTGRDFTLTFPFQVTAKGELNGFIETRGQRIVFVKDLGPTERESEFVMAQLKGFGNTAKDNVVCVENRKTSAGVCIKGERALYKLLFWTVKTVISPEPYLHFDIKPGETATWEIRYEFYAVK